MSASVGADGPVRSVDTGARPTAFLLHGFLGSGKTTFARRLEQRHSAVRFSHDEWMSRLHGADPPAAEFADLAARVSDLMERVWTRLLSIGCDVVLDTGFWSRAERMRVRALVAAHGGEAVLYRLTCSDAEAWTRIERRNAEPGDGLHIAPATYASLKGRFEPLGPDEPFLDAVPDVREPTSEA